MPFMRPEIFECDFWRVETSSGSEIVPQDVEHDPAKLGPYVEGVIKDPAEDVYAEHGWLGRLSAPGYLDCTDWITGETEQEVKDALADLYDLCAECWEHFEECACGACESEES